MTNLIAYLPDLLSGLSVTLTLMLASVAAGLVLAVLMTLCSISENIFLQKPVNLFIFFIRGTPLLVQLFLVYYGLGQFEWIRHSFLWIALREPTVCAIIALSVNTACYTSILLKGAIHSVPKSEIAACEALGMSKWLALRRIILPRAFRIALPAYSNEVIIVLKCTSLASTITLLDLMGVTQQLIAQTYDTITLYLLAGTLYLSLNAVIISVFKIVERGCRIPTQHAR
ncbi:ABC transporter permease [Aquicella lusitana]|uniref:Arginine ABC transporter permease protein ArtM n=1 Tax=Aquicella lusitana TaxID=254246 RepID=A0A370GFH8_9COXI|nr:ABC transporter permease [Aquicella lusitana]RDI42558.1 amino acid ABC transporter membrane protein 2 (PAAT family) [Aquicella lusitana]VVC74337.1 Octopine transport system permease protein OccM [Aquicella lusitana]